MPHERTGIVGLGLLGSAIAERLLKQERSLLGYDLSAGRCNALAERGVTISSSPAELFQQCDVTILSLPTSDVVGQLLTQWGGDLRKGTHLIDTTTGAPEQMVAFGSQLKERGISYLDATVAGSSAQVRSGEAVVLVGGEEKAFRACRAYFDAFARQVLHVGPHGSGAKMKLVHNLILGLHRAVLAEGLALAETLELELPRVLETLKVTPAYSTVMETKGTKMISEDFSPQATIAQHHKDVRLILAEAERAGVSLPLSTLHDQLLTEAERAGWGALDNSAIWKVLKPGGSV
jgi:3-hydroxyisobutyrate dehydrogenase-like beta-hydroxyacid dehydrogenase